MFYFDLLFVFFLILLNGVFAMSELAIVSAKKVHLKRLADEGNRAARLALDFAQDTGRFLPTVQIGITLIGVLSGAISGATLSQPLIQQLELLGVPNDTAEIIAVSGIVMVVTYLTLIAGELVPKELALRNPERMALFIAPIIHVLARVTSPAVWLLDVSCRWVLRLIGAGQKPITTVTEEEVRSMIEEGTQHGLFHHTERDMIEGIMLLADKPIRAFMMSRMDVVSIDDDSNFDTISTLLSQHHYSRYPVRRDGKIIGVVQTKRILQHLLAGQAWSLEHLLEPLATFPDSTPTVKMVEYLRTAPIHMAILADEHGSFAGIVTLTDLVEVMTGQLHQPDDQGNDAVKRADGSWLLDAGMLLEIAFQKVGIQKLPEENGYHTLAGFILHCLAVIPKAGDTLDYMGYQFEVMDMDGIRIDKVLVSKLPEFTPSI